MFDIGFMELLLIGTVALLVLGPDKLPGAIRTGALWFGRAKRSFNNVKSEIEQQINADEIRRQLHNETILGDIEKARKNADKLIKDTQAEIKNTEDSVKRSVSADGKTSTTTTVKATTSAEEGVPTPPPESYQVPDKAADSAETAPSHPKEPSPQESSAKEPVTSAETTPADSGADPVQASEQKQSQENSAPSQDIYSTPPSGIVSMQNGKFSAANDKPKNSDSSSGKK